MYVETSPETSRQPNIDPFQLFSRGVVQTWAQLSILWGFRRQRQLEVILLHVGSASSLLLFVDFWLINVDAMRMPCVHQGFFWASIGAHAGAAASSCLFSRGSCFNNLLFPLGEVKEGIKRDFQGWRRRAFASGWWITTVH